MSRKRCNQADQIKAGMVMQAAWADWWRRRGEKMTQSVEFKPYPKSIKVPFSGKT